MAVENKKSNLNVVSFEGYLKENTLQRFTTRAGKEAVSGSLTIALDETQDYRMRFMACQYNNNGQENRAYGMLLSLLPENTVSIATLLKSNPEMSFEQAKLQSSKIWMRGQFEAYDHKDAKGELQTTITVKGMSAGFKTGESKTPFTLKARFEVEGYVDNIRGEKQQGEETGRVIVTLAMPDYFNETIIPIDFICESNNVVNYIEQYQKGDTGHFVGEVRNIRKETVVPGSKTEFMDGTTMSKDKITYSFINERVIDNMTYPYQEGKSIPEDIIKQYKLNRAAHLEELDDDSATKAPLPSAPPVNSKSFVL